MRTHADDFVKNTAHAVEMSVTTLYSGGSIYFPSGAPTPHYLAFFAEIYEHERNWTEEDSASIGGFVTPRYKFFQFMQFLGTNWLNSSFSHPPLVFAPPPRGNHVSVTASLASSFGSANAL